MLILAIDTSGQSGGITLAESGQEPFRVIESAPIAGGTFSAQLVPTLAALLSKHGYSVKDLGGFAAASGPGSFTGLRVGLSAIKGLAEVLHKPIAVVSVLEALAELAGQTGRLAAALDAGRTEVFLGMYEVTANSARMLSEELFSQATFVEKMRESTALVTSDRSVAELASGAGISAQLVARPGSEMVAKIGGRKLLAGENISVEALDANYLRRSDAEIFFKAK